MRDPYLDEPTSQFPVPPLVAPPARRSFLRRHQGPLIVGAAAVAAGLIGGAGWAVGGTATTPAASPASSTSPSSRTAAAAAAAETVRGTVQSETGNTWIVRTGTDTTVTVTITAKTRFGHRKTSSSAAGFPVGTAVVITGRLHDSTLTANRITAPVTTAPAPSKATA